MRQANESLFRSVLSSDYFVPGCFIFYMLLRLCLIFVVPIDQFSDNLWYYTRGIGLASG